MPDSSIAPGLIGARLDKMRLYGFLGGGLAALAWLASPALFAAEVTVDDSPAAQRQVIDGFGTCIGGLGAEDWYQRAYYDDMRCSIMRMDLTPTFRAPYSDHAYNSPWFSNAPPLKIDDPAHPGGPNGNYVRTYSGPEDYTRVFGGNKAAIAVMGPDIEKNIAFFDFTKTASQGAMARAGLARRSQLGDFKLYGSIWSPAPWVKVANGQQWGPHNGIMPGTGTPYPFIWGGNFAGGKVDTSDQPLEIFNDGTGPTSALTQFARCTAAYVKGFQDTYGVKFYAISIQNEINFPEFYNSCVYATSPEYIAALKAVRRELDRHPDLKDIQIAGPEDLLGDSGYSLWQFGGDEHPTHKNLQYLAAIAKDPEAAAALGFFCIHGYANDGATAAGADSQPWRWWTDGWKTPPAPGLPADVAGFTAYGKKSWMTETSGEERDWLAPKIGFPGKGAWSIALKMQQALTTGRESACLYWQFADKDGAATTIESLTRREAFSAEPKYVAVKHFARFIRPGSVVVPATVTDDHGVTASAYAQSQDRTLTIVLVAKGTAVEVVTVKIPDDFKSATSWHAVLSSDSALWQESDLTPANNQLHLTLPPFSVATLTTAR